MKGKNKIVSANVLPQQGSAGLRFISFSVILNITSLLSGQMFRKHFPFLRCMQAEISGPSSCFPLFCC